MKKQNKVHAGAILNAVILVILGFITLYPFLYVLAISLSDFNSVSAGKVYLYPMGINLDAYIFALHDKRIGLGFFNAVVYSVSGTAISVFLTMLTAYPLAGDKLKYKRPLMLIIIGAMLFSGGLIPFYLLIRFLGWIDTIWAIIIPGAVAPFYLILTRTFIEQLPGELFEAAIIDGCSQMNLFIKIAVPLSMPIIATIALYYYVGLWNAYFWPSLVLNDVNKYPLQVFLRQIVIQSELNEAGADLKLNVRGSASLISESIKSAVLVITAFPILVIYPFLQKYFVKGILIGAIKG